MTRHFIIRNPVVDEKKLMVIIEMLLSFEKENVHEKRANEDIGYCPFYIYQSSSIVDQCGSAGCGGCALVAGC
jgi:hypothetical protein